MTQRFALLSVLIFLVFAGCDRTDDPLDPASFEVPATYAFTDASGASTVDFTDAHAQLNMLHEMADLLKTANTPGVSIDSSVLEAMFANDGYAWTDEEALGLADSPRALKDETAGGDPSVVAMFETWMSEVATASLSEVPGAAGVTGVVQSTTNPSKAYLMSGAGLEWTQLIEKGLMGACFYYNLSSVYLSDDQLNVDNTTPLPGATYTAMEHNWDLAYGYFTSAVDFPASGTDRFWGKYADGREELLGSATRISEAFRRGRAAISAGDDAARDAAADDIQTEFQRMIAGTAIHYFNAAVSNFGDDALRNHALSEAKAFIMALPYGAQTAVDSVAAAELLAALGDNFYEVTPAQLNAVRDDLAAATGLTEIRTQL